MPNEKTNGDALRIYLSGGFADGGAQQVRKLSFGATYTNCVASDIGKTVTGGTTGDTGELLAYDNVLKEWHVMMDDSGDLFDQAETVSVGSGTGTGTTSGASVAAAHHGAALGGYRSSAELDQLAFRGALENITTEQFGGGLEVGAASIQSDGAGNLRLTAPGDTTPGDYVAVGDGTTKVIEADGDMRWARVSRSGSAPAAGTQTIDLVDIFNLLWPNVDDTERAAGSDKYRGLLLKNESGSAITLRLYLDLLGTARTVDAGGYAASGGVTITITSDDLYDWPDAGFVYNQDTGEVLYYNAKTATTLTVAAAGRDVYSQVAGGAAGSSGDDLYPIPGLRLAVEDPSAQPGGFIQSIADEDTEPSGRTWQHPAGPTDPDVIEEWDLAAGYILGLWLHRKVVAGAEAASWVKNRVVVANWN